MRPLLVLLLLLVAGCGAGAEDGVVGSAPSPVTSDEPPRKVLENDLVVELDRGDGSPAERWTLVCAGAADGDHPDAEAACAHLEKLDDPFAPIPQDAICAQVYGGPQTASVTGLWRGDPVDLQLSRSDGCRIDQWDRLGPLLPP